MKKTTSTLNRIKAQLEIVYQRATQGLLLNRDYIIEQAGTLSENIITMCLQAKVIELISTGSKSEGNYYKWTYDGEITDALIDDIYAIYAQRREARKPKIESQQEATVIQSEITPEYPSLSSYTSEQLLEEIRNRLNITKQPELSNEQIPV